MTLEQCKENRKGIAPYIGQKVGANNYLVISVFIAPENQGELSKYLHEFSLKCFNESKVEFSKYSNESLFIYVLYKSGLIFTTERYTDFLSKNGLPLL